MYYPEYPTPLFLKICFVLIDNSIYILLTLNILLFIFKLKLEGKSFKKF